jgi:alkanesulfonate monooxygenase SsuD/methylene tetrahydromethanopterin reductase-like flavin-dependent oxidoreductase (luciferase family)
MKFGIFDHIDRREGPIHALYRDRLNFAEACDKAGFYGYHIAEHHQTPLGMAPSPNVYLAALAERTKRMRVASMVHLLPLYEPIRLIEEICMLDHLSGGRFEFGIGRGVSPYETGYFGVTPQESRIRFEEMLEIVLKGLTNDSFSHDSMRYKLYDVPMALRPMQQPHPPLWFGALSSDSLDQAARYGCNLVCGGPTDVVGKAIADYGLYWDKHKDKPWRKLSPVKAPFLGLWKRVVIAETDRAAQTLAAKAFDYHMNHLSLLWKKWGGLPGVYVPSAEEAVAHGHVCAGSPETVRDKLAEEVAATGANYLMVGMAFGTISHQQSLDSLAGFAETVMPALSKEFAPAK